jgi:hypothetical protein
MREERLRQRRMLQVFQQTLCALQLCCAKSARRERNASIATQNYAKRVPAPAAVRAESVSAKAVQQSNRRIVRLARKPHCRAISVSARRETR